MTRLHKQFLSWFLVIPLVFAVNLSVDILTAHGLNVRWLWGITSIIYAVLVLIWGRTLQRRIIHTQTRRCLITVSWFLFSLFILRMCRWLYFVKDDALNRMCWYLYYLAFIVIPLLSFYAAIGISRLQTNPRFFKMIWAACTLLVCGVLTNDLHHQLIQFEKDGSGIHHWLYGVVVIWSVLFTFSALFVLLRCCRLSACRKQLYVPVGMVLSGALLLVWYYLNGGSPMLCGIKLLYAQEAYAMAVIGLWEGCIMIGLMPSNTGYRQLFTKSHINAVLKDEREAVWYSSIHVQSSRAPDDLVTHTKKLNVGSVTWTEDIHTIRRLREQLAEANENLEEENVLIEEENRITAERTQYETQNRLYDRIAAHTRGQLAEIAESFTDTAAFTQNMRKNLLLGTYVKRCANLMLLADANPVLLTDELMLALRETMDTMRLFGIDCVLQAAGSRQYPAQVLTAVYDAAEAAAETVCGECSVFCISVIPDADTVLLLETDAPLSEGICHLPENTGLRLSVTESDDTYQMRIGGMRNGR